MSGHSKWSTIKQKKGAADAKRSSLFTKIAKNITIAARDGGDPDMNFKLRMAIDQAKSANMPKDNVERAIARGSGVGADDAKIEEVAYEGFGPGGVAFVIEALTDNRNRTSANIKSILSKHGGSMAGPGSVMWQFERKGVIRIADPAKIADRDAFELAVIDGGAEDIREDEEGIMITCEINDFQSVVKAIEDAGVESDYSALEYLAKEEVDANESTKATLQKIYDALDEDDDVDNFFTNEK